MQIRKTTRIEKPCGFCGEHFQADLREHNRGNAKYCSITCTKAGVAAAHRARAALKNLPNTSCAACSKSFYRNENRKDQSSKHGFHFCSRACKEKAQSLDSGVSIPEIMPAHYGNGDSASTYRERALRAVERKQCERCGYDEVPEVLQVHHRDRDRSNGHLSNLEVLCPTCHYVEHYRTSTGCFKGRVSTHDLVDLTGGIVDPDTLIGADWSAEQHGLALGGQSHVDHPRIL